ncbi:unnamed protein product [Paramecium primaurelia]|uniref:Transmembrane protein n=1 Tax=Paramecium primaurelia TaxID=5886 RepID=A0A8S1M8E2_PARPR|nr:unnamed protein product [Paramecium primaurelia]
MINKILLIIQSFKYQRKNIKMMILLNIIQNSLKIIKIKQNNMIQKQECLSSNKTKLKLKLKAHININKINDKIQILFFLLRQTCILKKKLKYKKRRFYEYIHSKKLVSALNIDDNLSQSIQPLAQSNFFKRIQIFQIQIYRIYFLLIEIIIIKFQLLLHQLNLQKILLKIQEFIQYLNLKITTIIIT